MAATPEPDQSYRPPSEEVVAAIRTHQREAHGRELDLHRDVYFPGNTPDGTIYDVTPITPKSAARFWCKTCGPGRVFVVGEPAYGTPERRAFLALNDRHLQTLLAATPHERRDELIDAYDRGELGPAILAATSARKRRQAAGRHRPDHQRRLDGFRTYFLNAYSQGGSIEGICEQLEDLYESDRDTYRNILGSPQPRTAETFRSWVYLTTTSEERDQAKTHARAAKDARRAARRLSLG